MDIKNNHKLLVYILESLTKDLTGKELFGILRNNDFGFNPEYVKYKPISTADELVISLNSIAQQTKPEDRPLVQVEAHGDEFGITLMDGSYLTWQELAPLYAEINRHCSGKLIISHSLCHGYKIYTNGIKAGAERCCKAIIGPDEMIDKDKLFNYNKKFFGAYLSSGDFQTAASVADQTVDPRVYQHILFED